MSEAIKSFNSSPPWPEISEDHIDKYDRRLVRFYKDTLHPRRTLDQFYYYMLEDTVARDNTQVVYKWATGGQDNVIEKEKKPSDPHIYMVDQFWLWIVDARMS